MSSEIIEFSDDEIKKLISEFDTPQRLEQFYFMLKLLTDDNINDDEDIDFDDYVLKQATSEVINNDNANNDDE